MRRPFKLVVAAVLTAVVCGTAWSQRMAGVDLDQAPRVTMPGMVSPRVRAAVGSGLDLGALAPETKIARVTLRFNLTGEQQRELEQLARDQQDPQSARYRQWMAPEQYAARFGLEAASLKVTAEWLRRQGLVVTEVARSGTFVSVSGTAAQMEAAFGVKLHRISVGGEVRRAALDEPALPAPLAEVVGSITGLDDLPLHSHAHAVPAYTSSTSGSHYLAPGDFYTIYDLNTLIGAGVNGTGQTIAVMGQTDLSLSDVTAFRSAAGLTAGSIVTHLSGADPGISAADVAEAQLDVEWAGAVAPAASILYVNSTDVLAGSLTAAVDNDLAPIISISYGECESSFGAAQIAVYNQLLRQATVQGQTVVTTGGDAGATDCDFGGTSATGGLAVDFPASSPYVVAVGGTMFNEGTATYWNATNGSYAGSALAYIPETVWNETATLGSLEASGGGASAFFTKPAWQVGTGVPNDFARDVPDVALNAGAAHDGYLVCANGSCSNGFRSAAGALNVLGGTSFGAPAFAGMLALLEQKIGASLGNVNPMIYSLAGSGYAGQVFHDVVAGNNASPCTMGSTGCPQGGVIGYAAGTGYDLATGWGSVDGGHLVADWLLVSPVGTGAAGTTGSNTVLSASSGTVSQGTAVALRATVSSGTGGAMPTGSVQILVDNVVVGGANALSGGVASYSLATGGLSVGTHVLTAAYSGDATYAGSKGAVNLTITVAAAGDFSLTPSASTISVAAGGTAAGVTFAVAPINGFAGNVTLSASSTTSMLGVTYSFNVDPVVLAGGSASSVLTLLAYVPERRGAGPVAHVERRSIVWLAAALLLFPLARVRRQAGLLMVLASLALLAGVGCGGGSPASSGTTGVNTPPGTYVVVVTASGVNSVGTAVTHNVQLTLTVQ